MLHNFPAASRVIDRVVQLRPRCASQQVTKHEESSSGVMPLESMEADEAMDAIGALMATSDEAVIDTLLSEVVPVPPALGADGASTAVQMDECR